MHNALIVGLGSALGGMARYGVALWLARRFGETFPWGTLVVNITGSFVIAFFFALTASEGRLPVNPDWRVFVMAGICGGYTTFSSFSLQTLVLLRSGDWQAAGWNVLGSVALCLASAWLGIACAAWLNPKL